MAGSRRPGAVSALSGLWLVIFGVDASLSGGGRSHQLGALALGLLFAGLVITEVRSHRRPPDTEG